MSDRANIVKRLQGDFTKLNYIIVDFGDAYEFRFTLYYEFEGKSRYCGDHTSLEEAIKYAEKRERLLSHGDTVLL